MPDGKEKFQISIHSSIGDIGQDDWDFCAKEGKNTVDNPFLSFDFLNALEATGCVSPDTGWMPQHLKLVDDQDDICAVMPLYIKNHSQGEYVFDWGWADAYERAGGDYYPKLLSAIPFTPITGSKFLCPSKKNKAQHQTALTSGLMQLVEKYKLSSAHMNFITKEDSQYLETLGFLTRNDLQFHWQNHNYQTFDQFLDTLLSRKRRSIRKERKKLSQSGMVFKRLTGDDLNAKAWDDFYRFYVDTYDRKWGAPYLNREFFVKIHATMRDQILLVMAYDPDGKAIAGALNLIGHDRLYGRNWGSDSSFKFLHFETCYYQAIEFAIERNLTFVEAGTQGQHKLQRGYMPIITYSAHFIRDTGFKSAIENFLNHEKKQIDQSISLLQEQSPYHINNEDI